MGSYEDGKTEVIKWIHSNFKQGDTCLDVGPCDGKWYNLLGQFFTMDAVEIFEPNIKNHQLDKKYNKVFNQDIVDLEYSYYDCIIFGDVIEHMSIEKAQKVLAYAGTRCKDMIVAVPFLYKQGEIYGNKWEIHIQDDLTKEIFHQRYPGYEAIWENNRYAYYHKIK